MLLTSLTKYQK